MSYNFRNTKEANELIGKIQKIFRKVEENSFRNQTKPN